VSALFCNLWAAGGGLARSGYHMVRPREEAGPRVVYCDLSRLPGEAGFERSFGSPGNLREKDVYESRRCRVEKRLVRCLRLSYGETK
jgi:hypothetical protein